MSELGHMLIAAQGCTLAQMNLQPWRTHLEIARHYLGLGWRVSFVTDGDATGCVLDACVFTGDVEWNTEGLAECVGRLKPTIMVWAVASTSVRHKRLLDLLECPVIALLTSPAYTWRQLLGGAMGAKLHEVRALLMQQCVPGSTWRGFLEHPRIQRVFVNSQRSLERLHDIGLDPDRAGILRVGLDDDLRETARSTKISRTAEGLRCVYMGSPKAIRGFGLLRKAMTRLCFRPKLLGLELRILARGSEPGFGANIHAEFAGAPGKVEVVEGNMRRADLLNEIKAAHVVLLPFLLAPSDVPIAVLEAMALGAVVISTDVDGIPELVEGRGVILGHRTAMALDGAITDLFHNPGRVAELSRAASAYAATYPTWSESLGQFAQEVAAACELELHEQEPAR